MNRLKIIDQNFKRTFFLSAFSFLLVFSHMVFAQKGKIMVMEIKSEINPAMSRYVELALQHAEDTKADIVLIEMNTYGGVLTDAKDIVQKLLAFKKPIWVFVNSNAASAGALISIACDSIYMSTGASIGAATVVDGEGQKAPDKYQSYMRGIMRSTAEANHRDPRIAEGMVDETFAIEGIKEAGKVITFSTSEAIKYGFCERQVDSIEEITKENQVSNYDIVPFELSSADKIIDFFLNPFISGVLILVILAGIYFEMQTPGMGFAGAAALVALILYLVPYYLGGLAENWEVLVLFVGFGLLAVEIFILPGFGVAGIAGIIAVIGSLMLIMLNNDFFDFQFVSRSSLVTAAIVSLGGLLGGVILLFIIGPRLLESKYFRSIALPDTLDSKQGYTANFISESLKGKTGIAHTVLRPSGKVLIDGKYYDAYSRGEYIEKDEPIEVLDHENTSLKVKKISA